MPVEEILKVRWLWLVLLHACQGIMESELAGACLGLFPSCLSAFLKVDPNGAYGVPSFSTDGSRLFLISCCCCVVCACHSSLSVLAFGGLTSSPEEALLWDFLSRKGFADPEVYEDLRLGGTMSENLRSLAGRRL